METTWPLSSKIAKADVVDLARCCHSPALEHPDSCCARATRFVGLDSAAAVGDQAVDQE